MAYGNSLLMPYLPSPGRILTRRPLRPEAKFADLGGARSRIQPGPECPSASADVRGVCAV